MIHEPTTDRHATYVDINHAVAIFRAAKAKGDTSTCLRLRAEWKAYNGADDLAQLATGHDEDETE